MAFMVIVNTPGSWSHIYAPLRHAPWDGCTPTDLVFPFFLFVVGVSLWLSIGRFTPTCAGTALAPTPSGFWTKIARRALVIFALGIFLNAFLRFNLEHLRIPGVLQRISLCFTLAALAVVVLKPWPRTIVATLALGAYAWALWFSGRGSAPDANIGRTIDIAIFSSDHLYRNSPTDPEGLLGTIPATVTVLLGFGIARRLFSADEELTHAHAWRTTALGAALTLAGLMLTPLIPLNKPLWSPSYVLFTAGLATAALSSISLLVDLGNARRWFAWLEVFGRNAMTLFVGSGILGRILGFITIGEGDAKRSLSAVIYENAFASWLGPLNGSLAYALSMLAFWWIVLFYMNRRGWLWRA
jgi:predicted acyltransferase